MPFDDLYSETWISDSKYPKQKKQISHKKYPTEHTILPFDDREAWIGDSWEKVASHQINNGNNRPNKVIFSLSVQPSASECKYIHCLQEEDFNSCLIGALKEKGIPFVELKEPNQKRRAKECQVYDLS